MLIGKNFSNGTNVNKSNVNFKAQLMKIECDEETPSSVSEIMQGIERYYPSTTFILTEGKNKPTMPGCENSNFYTDFKKLPKSFPKGTILIVNASKDSKQSPQTINFNTAEYNVSLGENHLKRYLG